MEWLRLYHGTSSDPKWPIIAKRSGQTQGTVVAVWVALLEYASQQDNRGSVEGFDAEGLDVLFGYEDGTTEAVMREMHDPKRGVLADGRIAAWESRQPKREDGSAERAKAWRDKKKETPNATERERTQPNADEQNRTQKNTDQNRTEKNREDLTALSADAETTDGIPAKEAAPARGPDGDKVPEKCRDGSPVAYAMTVQGGGQVRISEKQVAEWEKAFPAIPVKSELFRIQTWSRETTDPERWKKKEAFMATCNLLAKKNSAATPSHAPKSTGRVPSWL